MGSKYLDFEILILNLPTLQDYDRLVEIQANEAERQGLEESVNFEDKKRTPEDKSQPEIPPTKSSPSRILTPLSLSTPAN